MLNQLYKIALLLIIVLNAEGHTAWANSRQIAVDDSIAIASQFVEQLLPIGEYQADVLGESMMNPKQQELMQKMKMAIFNNLEWYQEVLRGLKPGEPVPYHEKLGVTAEEYAGMLKSFKNMKLGKMFSVPVKVIRVGGLLKFDGGNDLPFLDQIVVDFDSKCVIIQGDTLLYQKAIQMDSHKTTLVAGAWKGYVWNKEEISRGGVLITEPENLDITDSEGLNMSMYKCMIGKVDHTGQCFMYIKVMVMKDGEVVTKQDIALLIAI